MYFSLIRMRRGATSKDTAELGKFGGYHIHKVAWGFFSDGPERNRDFLYRHETVNSWPTFYTISEREPINYSGLWEIHNKNYAPKLRNGDRLSFAVRVNPIISKRDKSGKQNRHDVVMEAKRRIGFKNLPHDQRAHAATLIQEAGAEWLKSRESEYGFAINNSNVRADGYCQHRLFKGKGEKPVKFSTLEFTGILHITDPEVFVQNSLFKGIGPAKGFGCGLMLVKRI